MKEKNTIVVMRNENGEYLSRFKNNDNVLAFSVSFTDEIEAALFLPLKYYEMQKADIDHLAEMVKCVPLKVDVDYTITTLDGEEPAEIVKSERDSAKEALKNILFGDE